MGECRLWGLKEKLHVAVLYSSLEQLDIWRNILICFLAKKIDATPMFTY